MNHISTRIYTADVTELENENLYMAAYEKITDERKKKTDQFRLPEDRRLSVGAELLLMYGLNRLGINLKEMRYNYGENGKPYLKNAEDVFFNLSHSEDKVVCAISSREIGCDIEKISAGNFKLAKHFFATEEYEMIVNQKTEMSRREMFFRLWTLKESFIKATGLGLSQRMDSFSIRFDKNGILLDQTLDQEIYYFQELDLWKDYKCSICGLDSEISRKTGVSVEKVDFSNPD